MLFYFLLINRIVCSVKKSTPQQLQELVKAMMEDSDLAKGIPVFGGSKYTVDEKWKTITTKLNMHGPPMRTTAEWRKVCTII